MGIFNKIGKGLTNVGMDVADQTKKLTNVAKLEFSISEREKKISQLFTALGQTYYETRKNDADAEFQDFIHELRSQFSEIAQFQEEIKQLKGVVKCDCGAEVSIHAKFCHTCGAPIIAEYTISSTNNLNTCPNCGKLVDCDNLFCNHCGTKMDSIE